MNKYKIRHKVPTMKLITGDECYKEHLTTVVVY